MLPMASPLVGASPHVHWGYNGVWGPCATQLIFVDRDLMEPGEAVKTWISGLH